jgi:hypothetical protein
MELTADDRFAIQDLCALACHALDFGDPDGFADLFLPDGSFQRRGPLAAGGEVIFRHEGREQLRAFAVKAAGFRQGLARHWSANILIRPTTAGAEANSYTMLVANDAQTRDVAIAIAGTYQDVFTMTPAGWRFASRTVTDDI